MRSSEGCPSSRPAIAQFFGPLERSTSEIVVMEHVLHLHIERLPEGVYLATSDDVQGLVAQGRTIQETIEIARDVARRLMESQQSSVGALPAAGESFDYPLIVAS